MATEEQIEQLRRMTDVADGDDVYTSELLNQYIDNLGGDLAAAAGAVWSEKAATYAGLVDVSESGSSRRLSQLASQALAMKKHFVPEEEQPGDAGASFTVAVERV